MNKTLILPDNLREELKKPLGRIVRNLDELKTRESVICVGDESSEYLLRNDFKPRICIYDNKIRRKNVKTSEFIKKFKAREIFIENPPGSITEEAFLAVRDAFSSEERTKIKVEGEEDLLTLVAIKLAPKNSLVLYGQPDEGLVVVDVNEKIKNKVEDILKRMDYEN